MTRSVVALDVDASLVDALALVNERRISCLPVLDAEHRIVGVLDERQVLRAFVTRSADTVGELTGGRMVCLGEDVPVDAVAAAILDNDVPAAAIMSGDELVGIMTRGDALRGLLRDRATRFAAEDGAGGWRVSVDDGVVTIASQGPRPLIA